MSTRTAQIVIVALALVGIPGIVGAVTKTEAPTAEPTKAALDVKLAEDEVEDGLAFLSIRADGSPPGGDERFTLVDKGGLHPVVVESRDVEECSKLELDTRYATSASGQEWCLALSDVAVGHRVSGAVRASGTTIDLAVSRREPFFWNPLLIAGAGLLLGIPIALVPAWLRRRVRKGLLEQLLRDNERAPDGLRIDGLRTWVNQRRDANISDDALLPVVDSVIELGPPAARRWRAELRAKVTATVLPKTHPFVKAADKQSRSTENHVDHFLKEDGSSRTPHPVREWTSGLALLETEHAALVTARREIDALDPTIPREAPEKALGEANAALAAVYEPPAVAGVVAKRRAVEIAIAEAKQTRLETDFLVAGARTTGITDVAAEPGEVAGGRPLAPAPSLGRLWLVTVGLVILVVAWALLAIEQTVYEPNATFGTPTDYLALLTAAVGSGAATTVLALLAIWDPSSSATQD
jgi:hypothetical protein